MYRKSSHSDTTNCVEVALTHDGAMVSVRDSNAPDLAITCTRDDWEAFLAGAADGEFSLDRLTPTSL